jgi:hypothetical protein
MHGSFAITPRLGAKSGDRESHHSIQFLALTLAVVARIRHRHTRYDQLLMRGYYRNEARASIRDEVDRVLESWRNPG